MTRFTQTEGWKRLLIEPDAHERHLLLLAHVRMLSADEVEELADLLEKGSAPERETALSFFYQMSHRGDPRVTAMLRKRLSPTVEALARKQYPLEFAGRMAFAVWRYVDKGPAYLFLNQLEMEAFPEDRWFEFIVDLSLGTNRSLQALRDIQKRQPAWAARIERQLERAALMAARRVATLSDEWKNTRGFKTLQKLQMAFLNDAHNFPMHVVLEVMGEADANSGHNYTYFCFQNGARSGSVRLTADESGRFVQEEIIEEKE